MSSTCTGDRAYPAGRAPRASVSRLARRRSARGGRRRALGALQPPDERGEEHAVESQLAGGRDLLEERRAHLQHRHRRGCTDRGGTLGARHIARLAEAVAGIERTATIRAASAVTVL